MKQRTRRSAAKRFKLTGSGKIKRRRSHHSHILTKKSSKRKRGMRKWTGISPTDVNRVKLMLRLK